MDCLSVAPLFADFASAWYLSSVLFLVFVFGRFHCFSLFSIFCFGIFRFIFAFGMFICIGSPFLIIDIGPFSIASGDMCPMAAPLVAPLNLPSVISATSPFSLLPLILEVGVSISLIPGPPFGPSYLMTITSPLLILLLSMAFTHSSSLLNTFAFPLNFIIFLDTAVCFTTAPFGAMFPYSIFIPPCLCTGFSLVLIISVDFLLFILFFRVPFTVFWFRCSSFCSLWSTVGIPPALCRSISSCGPAGLMLTRCGIFSESWLKFFCLNFISASSAMASRCSTEFVDPPSARSTIAAFRIDFFVIMSFIFVLFSISSVIVFPVLYACFFFLSVSACVVASFGRLRPIVSIAEAIVFAVNIPAHDPGPGQALCCISLSSFSVISPCLYWLTASITVE